MPHASSLRRKSGSGGSPPPVTLPQVQAYSAQDMHEGWGLCQHPNFGTSVHKHQTQLIARYNATNIYHQRGGGKPGITTVNECIAAIKASGGPKWCMAVLDEGAVEQPDTAAGNTAWQNALTNMEEKLDEINADPVLCSYILSFEGPNEPNHNRGATAPPMTDAEWLSVRAPRVVECHRRLWRKVFGFNGVPGLSNLQNVKIVGPGLHDGALDATNGKHASDLAALGLGQYLHYPNVHSYCAGAKADTNLAKRIGFQKTAFGSNVKVWVTEAGWQTYVADPTTGRKPVSEAAQAIYMSRSILEMGRHPDVHAWDAYEALDDPPRNDVQSYFGIWRVGTSVDADPDGPNGWTEKPAVGRIRDILTWLEDPGTAYTPGTVGLKVEAPANDSAGAPSAIDYTAVQRRDGTTRVFLFRNRSCWNTATRTDIAVPTVPVTITDAQGPRLVAGGVGSHVKWLDLRS